MAWNVSMIPNMGKTASKFVLTITAATYSGTLSTSGGGVTIQWGDGTSTSYNGTDQAFSHSYSGSSTYTVTFVNSNRLTKLSTSGNFATSFSLSSLPAGMTYFYCSGSNSISGSLSSLPAGMTDFICIGSNSISGSLSSLPAGMTDFYCTGSNSISGSLSSLPAGIAYFYCGGSNSISGSLSSLPAGMKDFYCTGSNTIDEYTTKTWASNQRRVYLIPVSPGGLSSAEVDQLLIDLASAGGTWAGDKQVYLRGTNAARTSASDAAVATLVGKGVSVTTTP
jgi:hypothetical protein